MTNAEARCNKSLRPRKPEGSLGRTAQDVHLDSHTAPELWTRRAQRTIFNTLDNWGHKTPTQSKKRKDKKQKVKGSWPGTHTIHSVTLKSPVFFPHARAIKRPQLFFLFFHVFFSLFSCCLTSTEARWPIRDGDRVGRGRESERLDRGNRPKKTGETADRRQNNGSVKAVSPRHCPATCAPCNCSFNCCAGQSH